MRWWGSERRAGRPAAQRRRYRRTGSGGGAPNVPAAGLPCCMAQRQARGALPHRRSPHRVRTAKQSMTMPLSATCRFFCRAAFLLSCRSTAAYAASRMPS